MRLSIPLFLILLLIGPYLLLLALAPSLQFQWNSDFLNPMIQGVTQALLSSVLALALGLLCSLGLFATSGSKSNNWVELSLLAPNFVPPLFTVLSVLSLCHFLGVSHQGLHWVVLTHGLMNAGLFAIAIFRFVGLRAAGPVEAAKVFGVSPAKILKGIVLPALVRPLSFTFVFVFGLCLVSFSIPLILGGPGTTSLEIHIFRLVRNGSWGAALIFSAFQSVLILLVSGLIFRTRLDPAQDSTPRYWNFSKSFVFLSLIPMILLCGFWLFDVAQVLFSANWSHLHFDFWAVPLINSLILSLLVFMILCLFSFVVCSQSPKGILFQFLRGYISPSLAVIAFALILVPGEREGVQVVKTAVAFSLLVFPVLFRWMVLAEWKTLESQSRVARVFGASSVKIAGQVLWPQLLKSILSMSLLGMVWMIGDFSVSAFFFNGDRTLALKVTGFLNSYELDSAYLFSFFVFAASFILFFVGRKVITYVAD